MIFLASGDLEVQERAVFGVELMKLIAESVAQGCALFIFCAPSRLQLIGASGEPLYATVATLFEGELNPVHPTAIDHVPIPEGLNLDEWIHEPPPESSFEVQDFLLIFVSDIDYNFTGQQR